MKKNRSTRLSILISLALHSAVVLCLLFMKHSDHLPVRHKTAEVELIDPAKLQAAMKQQEMMKQGQIVDQDEKAINDEKPKDAKYLSRHDQKVLKETQAATNGKFKNTNDMSGEKAVVKKIGKTSAEKKEKVVKAEKQYATSEDGLAVHGKPTLRDLTPSFKPPQESAEAEDVAQGGGTGPSANDDHLKDVQTGMQTLLSTREFVYYSYYNRIKDKLRQYWEPKIKEKMERIMRQGRTIASKTDRITKVIIVLDDRGTLIRVQVIGESGVTDLDQAAVEAFRAAAPFPNPPKGIVESDGTIKIRWDFILEA